MQTKESNIAIEYEMEIVINRQLYKENYITYEIYEKVNAMILKDIGILAGKSGISSEITEKADVQK